GSPLGISAQTSHFMDAFLLFCAVEDSPDFPNSGFCQDSHDNFARTAKEGRRPGLVLTTPEGPISLKEWGAQLMERIAPYAGALDSAQGVSAHTEALRAQAEKIRDPEQTPSA